MDLTACAGCLADFIDNLFGFLANLCKLGVSRQKGLAAKSTVGRKKVFRPQASLGQFSVRRAMYGLSCSGSGVMGTLRDGRIFQHCIHPPGHLSAGSCSTR